MNIKIKNVKSLQDLERERRKKINDNVVTYLAKNGYLVNPLAVDPLQDLIDRLHKDNLKVIVDTKNEKLNINQINKSYVLTFDLIIYFKALKT